MNNCAIRVENVGKRYRIRQGHERQRYIALRDVIAGKFATSARWLGELGRVKAPANQRSSKLGRSSLEDFWALKDISFDVRQGEVIGIIGRNGAGKSTLLKVLSRITTQTEGRVTLRGRLASLLEVGTGFHPELTGRENILLNGAILGMRRAEINSKFEEIVAFSGVESFLETPVKRYSSGMYVRLAFAVAAHLEPEILVVDEVLAVGDAEFQRKCLGRMRDVATSGRTVLFVSHNMNTVERLCNRVVHLDGGRVSGIFDDARHGIMTYLKGTSEGNPARWVNDGRHSYRHFRPVSLSARTSASDGRPGEPFSNAFPIVVEVDLDVHETDPALNIGLAVYDEQGNSLFWSFMKDVEESLWPSLASGPATFTVEIPPRWLNEGNYRVELLAGLHCRGWFLEPGVNAPSITFEIQGGLSDSPIWDSRRPGIWAPQLQWERV
jgi:lipopolysaccharide transport system ATP-binding protein